MEEHHGYELPMSGAGAEHTRSVLKPYGVWAVVAPFNFPLALGTGMAAGALVAGNTVVFKPASDTPYSGICLYETLSDAGLSQDHRERVKPEEMLIIANRIKTETSGK